MSPPTTPVVRLSTATRPYMLARTSEPIAAHIVELERNRGLRGCASAIAVAVLEGCVVSCSVPGEIVSGLFTLGGTLLGRIVTKTPLGVKPGAPANAVPHF